MPQESFNIKVDGLAKLDHTVQGLETGRYRFMEELVDGLASSIRSNIRSRTGRLAASWKGHAITSTEGVVETTGAPDGKASVRGAYIRAKPGHVLAFRGRDGSMVFRRWVRLAPGNWIGRPGDRKNSYVTRAFRRRSTITAEAMRRSYGRIGEATL